MQKHVSSEISAATLTPKAAKEHGSVCFRLLLCNLSKGFIKIIASPFMRQETMEFEISLGYIVREGST